MDCYFRYKGVIHARLMYCCNTVPLTKLNKIKWEVTMAHGRIVMRKDGGKGWGMDSVIQKGFGGWCDFKWCLDPSHRRRNMFCMAGRIPQV